MAYIKQTWIDNESPLTAERMNHIEDGISNNDVSITSLDTRINSLAGGGQPIVVTQASDMTDQTKIYLYVGEETGYETGHWYYYDTTWTDGGQYGADGGVNTNARNILRYILQRVAYTETGMDVYVNALYEALAQAGGSGGSSETTSYMIMNALTHVTNSNDATGCDEGDSYSATLSADTDYTIDSVTVTMGGTDITSTVYSNGTITIASVTGDIVITASAVAETWDIEWSYEDGGLPNVVDTANWTLSQNTSGSATFVENEGIRVYRTNGPTYTIYPKNYQTSSSSAYETVFNFTTMPTVNGLILRLGNGTIGMQATIGNGGISIDNGSSLISGVSISTGVDYTVRAICNTTGTCELYLDGTLLWSGSASDIGNKKNHFMVTSTTSTDMYIRSIKFKV